MISNEIKELQSINGGGKTVPDTTPTSKTTDNPLDPQIKTTFFQCTI